MMIWDWYQPRKPDALPDPYAASRRTPAFGGVKSWNVCSPADSGDDSFCGFTEKMYPTGNSQSYHRHYQINLKN